MLQGGDSYHFPSPMPASATSTLAAGGAVSAGIVAGGERFQSHADKLLVVKLLVGLPVALLGRHPHGLPECVNLFGDLAHGVLGLGRLTHMPRLIGVPVYFPRKRLMIAQIPLCVLLGSSPPAGLCFIWLVLRATTIRLFLVSGLIVAGRKLRSVAVRPALQ